MTKVTSVEMLKEMIENAVHDFFIQLEFGARSSKMIDFNPETNRFEIINEIDNTKQKLTEANLFNRKYTNIGYALSIGALYSYEDYDAKAYNFIRVEEAQNKLIEAAKSYASIEDRLYELAQDLTLEMIQNIEKKSSVVDDEGTVVTSDSNESELWYDDVRDEAMQYLYDKMADFFKRE